MAQVQVTLVKIPDWRAPRGLGAFFTYRDAARAKSLTFSGDKMVIGINPDGFPSPPPEQVRVTVEWSEASEEPLPSNP